jgi:ankyrin repeat protein
VRSPARPSLASLRKQAKSLLSDHRDGSSEAISVVQQHHPKPDRFSSLRDAQLVIARRYGYQGWAELTNAVESAVDSVLDLVDRADLFADLACLCYSGDEDVHRRERAGRLLSETPELTGASLFAAAVASDVGALHGHLASDSGCANEVGGPRDWTALMYVAYSRLPENVSAGDPVAATCLLLDNGADPRFYVDGSKGLGGWRWTALTGVIGEGESGDVQQAPHPRAREIAELLLGAGADPNDSQALYNCHFTPGTEWLELLLSHGLTADAPTNPDDPTEETTLNYQLGAAVRTGNTDATRLLLQHGADASGRDDRYTERSYVENVVTNGYGDILELLVSHGSEQPELTAADRFRFAVVAGNAEEAERLSSENPAVMDQPGLLVGLAGGNRHDAAQLLLELGTDPNGMNGNGRGALHEAAWSGHREMIDLLLEHGARLDVRSTAHGGTPVGYANHAGRFELRDFLLERTNDVLDLVSYGKVGRLNAVLAEEPNLIDQTRDDGTTLMDIARCKADEQLIQVLQRHGAS